MVDASLEVGHAHLTFSGRWAPMNTSEGRPVGLFLSGRGNLQVTSTYEPERIVMSRNLAEWPKVQVRDNAAKNPSMMLSFDQARIWWVGPALPAWGGDPGGSLEAECKAHAELFQLAEVVDAAQTVALQAQNAPAKPLVVMELRQGDDVWLYTFDSFHDQIERLDWLHLDRSGIPTMKGRRSPVVMSRQPLGWDPRKAPQAPLFQISSLDVDLRSPENRNLEAHVEELITPVESGLKLLRFRLVSEVITEKDVRKCQVLRVVDGEGRELAFDLAKDHLIVQLAAPTERGKQLRLTFDYRGDTLVQPGEDSYWQLDVNGAWYPQSESLAGESYLFHGKIRTKGDWIAFLPGETLRREKDGEWNLVETRTEKPICFATVLGGRYQLEEETRDGITLRIATYAFKGGSGLRVIKDQAFNVIRYYQFLLGPFPFKEFQVVQKNQWGYGQAPPGMMYITNEAFNQMLGVGQYAREGLRKRFAHEIAHQYWGTVVKMPSSEDQWVTEAFADYSAAMYEGEFKGQGLFARSVATWTANAKEAAKYAPIPLANDIAPRDGYERFKTRTYLLYDKAPLLLHAIRKQIGDHMFMVYLKSIQANFKWRFASTPNLIGLLNFATKRDFNEFFTKYFWGTEMPPEKP